MGLLDVLRAAVGPAAAARTGYLTGQEQGRDKRRKEQRDDAAIERQSRLDQMKAMLDQSNIDENRSQAEYNRRRPAAGSTTAPRTINTTEGILQWDAAQGKYVPTGHKAPIPASERNAPKREARESRLEQQGQLSGVNKQIDDTRADLRFEDTAPSDETGSRIGQLRTRLDSLTHVGDSLNTVIKGGKATAPKRVITKDQADYLRTQQKMSEAEIQRHYRVTP